MGYAGGELESPNYGNMGDHTETVQVDYDPRRISYRRLLDIFWKEHRPARGSWSRQYLNAVFYHNAQQRREALASRDAVAQEMGRAVKTEVLPLRAFTLAEDYHQKYTLNRYQELRSEMRRVYPILRDFVDSTAVTRLNGYAGGHGTRDQLAREIDRLGLSADGKKRLAALVRE